MKKSKIIELVLITAALSSCHREYVRSKTSYSYDPPDSCAINDYNHVPMMGIGPNLQNDSTGQGMQVDSNRLGNISPDSAGFNFQNMPTGAFQNILSVLPNNNLGFSMAQNYNPSYRPNMHFYNNFMWLRAFRSLRIFGVHTHHAHCSHTGVHAHWGNGNVIRSGFGGSIVTARS